MLFFLCIYIFLISCLFFSPSLFILLNLMSTFQEEQKQLLHTKDRLIKLYGVDLMSAFSSAAMVAPFIAIVDR